MYDSYFFPYLIPLCGCSLPLCPPPPPAREEEEEDDSCALLLRSMFTRSMYSARASVAIWRGTKKERIDCRKFVVVVFFVAITAFSCREPRLVGQKRAWGAVAC